MDKIGETICAKCPFRRDSKRMKNPLKFVTEHGWPGFEPHVCKKQQSICLGWIIFIRNQAASIQVQDRELQQEIGEWARDVDLVFGSDAELLRYHRGEWFGSEDWRSNWRSRFSAEPEEESPAQGELDL